MIMNKIYAELNTLEDNMCEYGTYDYVTIGTGTAGFLLAKRLSDDLRTSVLSLEAGENNSHDRPYVIRVSPHLLFYVTIILSNMVA